MEQAISIAPTNQDQALLEQIEQRDAGALSELYDRYAGRVYQLALTVTGSPASAEEATADTFMDVWSRPERYRSSYIPLSKWVLAIAWRCARRRRAALHDARTRIRRSDESSEGSVPQVQPLCQRCA